MEDGYDGMLVILQNFLANQKHSESQAYRISMCATKIAEAVGLDAGSVDDIRTAALLFNLKELGITNEVLCKAAQVSADDLQHGLESRRKNTSKAGVMGGALQRAIPHFSLRATSSASSAPNPMTHRSKSKFLCLRKSMNP